MPQRMCRRAWPVRGVRDDGRFGSPPAPGCPGATSASACFVQRYRTYGYVVVRIVAQGAAVGARRRGGRSAIPVGDITKSLAPMYMTAKVRRMRAMMLPGLVGEPAQMSMPRQRVPRCPDRPACCSCTVWGRRHGAGRTGCPRRLRRDTTAADLSGSGPTCSSPGRTTRRRPS